MPAFELECSRGRWLAPLEFVDELYDALLRLPAKGQDGYITLGSRDSDVEIFCATKQSRFVKEPYAYTESQAKSKLSAWRDERDSGRCKSCGQSSETGSPVVEPAAAASTASETPMTPKPPTAPFAVTETEAVRSLRERGYIIAPPYPRAGDFGSITPPPPYAVHLSSSQPVQSITKHTDESLASACKRKRDNDRIVAQANGCPPTPIRELDTAAVAQARDADAELEADDDGSDGGDEEAVVSAPQRKKRKTKRSTRDNLPQKPASPPRCTKTKRGALTNTVSCEAVAELTGAGPEVVQQTQSHVEGDSDVSIGDEGVRPAAGEDGQTVPTLPNAVPDPPPTSSPEEIGAMNLLSLSISAPSTPSANPAVDEGEDTLFVPEDPPVVAPLARSLTAARLEDNISRNADLTAASPGHVADILTTGLPDWSDGDRMLYRHFCEDVKAAERRWDHPSTRQGMARLREREPLLQPTFMRCLAIARKTMSEDVLHEWRNFQEQGWEKRRQHGFGLERPATETSCASLPAVEPARRDVVVEAYRQFKEATRASTNTWKARFHYRRAAVRLAVQYDSYSSLRCGQSSCPSSASQHDRSALLRALFREMRQDWRDALPDNFTEKQAKDQGHIYEWRAFNQTIQDGRRWNLFVENLGLGALLLIDTSKNNEYIQRQAPIPVFAAWTHLISRVRSDVKEIAARVEGYYDGMEEPSFYAARKLRPLKLERRAYRAHSPAEQFEFSGSEGGKTPTADPSCLAQLDETVASIYRQDCVMDDFIRSSSIEDEDFAIL